MPLPLTLLAGVAAFGGGCSLGDIQDCQVPHGSGYQHCDNGSWSKCVVAQCEFGYYIGGIADSCVCLMNCDSGPAPGPTATVTVTATATSGATAAPGAGAKPTATSTTTATSSASNDTVAQKDSYCEGASLQFMNSVSFLRQGAADKGVTSYTQGEELLRRAQRMNGTCSAPVVEGFLANPDLKKATGQLEKDTGVNAHELAEFTRDRSEALGGGREGSAAAALKALLRRAKGDWRPGAIASLEKLGEKPPKEGSSTAGQEKPAEALPAAAGGQPESSTAPAPEASSAPFQGEVSTAPVKPAVPVKSGDSSLLELKELQLMMTSAAAGEGPAAVEQKLREFTIFTRVRLRYQKYQRSFLPDPR